MSTVSVLRSIKSNLYYSVDYLVFTRMNNEDYMRLFIADTFIHNYDDYVINKKFTTIKLLSVFYHD